MIKIVASEISFNVLFTMDTDTEERILLCYGLYKINTFHSRLHIERFVNQLAGCRCFN